MSEILLVILVLGFGFMALLYARKYGAKSEALKQEKERLLNEAKQRQRANQIISNVGRLDSDTISDRLSNIAASKRK
jgi:hypothetical protein